MVKFFIYLACFRKPIIILKWDRHQCDYMYELLMFVSLYSGYVDILIEKVRTFAQNGEIPHFDDVENVPPPLCEEFPHPDKDLAVQTLLTRFRLNWSPGIVHQPRETSALFCVQHKRAKELGRSCQASPNTIWLAGDRQYTLSVWKCKQNKI